MPLQGHGRSALEVTSAIATINVTSNARAAGTLIPNRRTLSK
jgi:hypothetical protein